MTKGFLINQHMLLDKNQVHVEQNSNLQLLDYRLDQASSPSQTKVYCFKDLWGISLKPPPSNLHMKYIDISIIYRKNLCCEISKILMAGYFPFVKKLLSMCLIK